MPESVADEIVSIGIDGLDDVLGGGLQRRRLYVVEGVPGSGVNGDPSAATGFAPI